MSDRCVGRSFPRRALPVFLWAWFALTLPVVTVLTLNEYSRFTLLQTCAHWRGKWLGSDSVFIGDSLTAGGRNWGWRLGRGPFSSRNLAASGCTVRQVQAQAREALKYKPARVFVMVGTNDLLEERDEAAVLRDCETLLHILSASWRPPRIVVTLVPQTAYEKYSEKVRVFNRRLRELCQSQAVEVVDLTPQIAPQGVLLPQYSLDGVHLSAAAYQVWTKALRGVIARAPAK